MSGFIYPAIIHWLRLRLHRNNTLSLYCIFIQENDKRDGKHNVATVARLKPDTVCPYLNILSVNYPAVEQGK